MDRSSEVVDISVTLFVVMGPSGCGKTTIGKALAEKLGVPFLEGDHLHPKANIDKMSNGIPLNDDDRWPWLSAIRERCSALAIEQVKSRSQTRSYLVITCSALKKSYRNFLRNIANIERTIFVYPCGSFELILDRMRQRQNHFMKSSMLESQFATLEPPLDDEKDVAIVPIDKPLESSVQQIIALVSP